MFSSSAYEAFYAYIGIYLHEASIKIITSQEVLIGLLVLILGYSFIITTWRFSSKYMPGFLGKGRSAGAATFLKVIACFVMGVTLLKVDSNSKVKNYKRVSWHTNPYIGSKFPDVNESYKVSFLFEILSSSAEEIARLGSHVVDELFKTTNSQLEAPAAFYKAVMYAASTTIEDPDLRDKIDVYTRSCFEKVLPLIGLAKQKNKYDEFFNANGVVDQELKLIPIELEDGERISCLDLKNEVREHLWQYSREKGADYYHRYSGKFVHKAIKITEEDQKNMIASAALVNHELSKTEDIRGTQKGAKVQGSFSKFILGWNRVRSLDGFLHTVGLKDQVGANLTAQRMEKFSEYLQRAPHIKGMVKMFLIALFPWLVFFIVAGKWKVIIAWYAVYVSVLLWEPIWVLLYHLMTSIALSTDTMAQFGMLSDGISLYGSIFITTKLYQFYALYSWLQMIAGPLPTVILAYGMFSSFLKDSEGEQAPEAITMAKDVAVSGATGSMPALQKSSVAQTVSRRI